MWYNTRTLLPEFEAGRKMTPPEQANLR